jgi:hypothetical protein
MSNVHRIAIAIAIAVREFGRRTAVVPEDFQDMV